MPALPVAPPADQMPVAFAATWLSDTVAMIAAEPPVPSALNPKLLFLRRLTPRLPP
jgi:hypothetical protein